MIVVINVNIIATLFLAEVHYDLPLLMDKLLLLYDTEPDRQALMLFINWFRQLAARGKLSRTDFEQIEEQDLTREEVKSMLVKALEREREIIWQEGFDDGKKEGFDDGKKEGFDDGKKKGFDEGTKEAIETRNRQLVRAMSDKGYSQAVIADLLMLALPEVERLLTTPEQRLT